MADMVDDEELFLYVGLRAALRLVWVAAGALVVWDGGGRQTLAATPSDIVGSRAHMHLDVICCISPHLERCTRHQDSSRRALRNICLHLVVIF